MFSRFDTPKTRCAPPRRVLAALIIGALGLCASHRAWADGADSAGIDFDPVLLKAHGIDPAVSDYFRHAPRFTPGAHVVTLTVNGNPRGSLTAQFDAQGSLCFNPALLRQAGLAVPKALLGSAGTQNTASSCYDYRHDYPQAVVNLQPNRDAVTLVVPTQALAVPVLSADDYTHGGRAALFNYNALAMTNHFAGKSRQYQQADTEVGFNANDWLVRSRQIYTKQDGRTNWSHPYAYAQKTLVERKAIVQIGKINVVNTPFALAPIEGAQLFPETALATPAGSGAQVQGIAQTQARVEVRQLGVLVYSTMVPPGPFTLSDLPLINGSADLNVVVTESNGLTQTFAVPAGSFHAGVSLAAPQGFSLAAGRLRNESNIANAQTPWLITASDGWRLGRQANVSASVLVSAPYQAIAAGIDTAPTQNVTTSATVLTSHTRDGHQGAQLNLSAAMSWAHGISISASAMQQTPGYRNLTDIVIPALASDQWQTPGASPSTEQLADPSQPSPQPWLAGQLKGQYTVGASWSDAHLGAFSVNAMRATQYYGRATRRIVGSWSRSFSHATVTLNVEHNLGRGQAGGNAAYLNLSIPLDRQSSLSAYASQADGRARFGARYQQSVSPTLGYSLEADRDAHDQVTGMSASVHAVPHVAQLNLTASRPDQGSSMLSGQALGGVVIGGGGVTFSPYPIRDTFGVISIGSNVSGVQISTPEGPVWTNHHGRAVVASLPAYATSRLEVATKTLPRNADIGNGLKVLAAGHGSVNRIGFDVTKVRRTLLSTHMEDGAMIAMGGTVIDANGNFVTTTGDDGVIFLPNNDGVQPLSVRSSDGHVCQLGYTLPKSANADRFYDQVDAVCKPVSAKNS